MKEIVDHLPRLRRYARALTGDAAASEDLVQDTVERALARLDLFRPGSRLDAWLLSVMHNLFISQLRRDARLPQEDSADELADELPVRGTQTDALELRDLDRALARLPSAQREVLLLISLEEFTYEEAAHILGVPVGTVMSRLARAREKLRAILAGADTPSAPQSVMHLKVVK
ncbi:sigma-70 family RNA polymerase sigma factor [Noviherbaspirillum aridicola]|uniref:RNA polymerase sigma factor n=1 Tax=Noviherbaspirillum aridicola TaxID=2849687 RepID=A0ABQ4PZV8_9BURK|nr:sigma-70 family RNA polymerase sigma factor [Noviherbaspirillum aridicola]GIZ50351.1 RNA polymerase sigma factor [Noviherbaspirillum aridicola]